MWLSVDRFCQRVQELPTGQSVALLKQITLSLKSAFLERLCPSSETENEEEIQTTTKRKKKKKKRRYSQRDNGMILCGESLTSCFISALLCGVDLLSLVLLNTPLAVWRTRGLHRERARAALGAVQQDVVQPLMEAARQRVSSFKKLYFIIIHFSFLIFVKF